MLFNSLRDAFGGIYNINYDRGTHKYTFKHAERKRDDVRAHKPRGYLNSFIVGVNHLHAAHLK